jgi:predicted DNA-binding ribbon-helix-helix protein
MGKYRKTITLDPKYWVYLRKQSENRGISMAKLIERLVDSDMHQNAPKSCTESELR